MTLTIVKEQDGMIIALVKEQDGMTLAKVRHAQVSLAPTLKCQVSSCISSLT